MEGHPCPDCRWTLYLMTGRPILVLRCRDCSNWFHANIKVVSKVPSSIGMAWEFDAEFNHKCTKDDLNSILRCDCLARQVYMVYSLRCDKCQRLPGAMGSWRHTVRVRANDTLHHFITSLTSRSYKHSNLPAYTLQRRCGAIEAYLDRYMKEVMTPAQAIRTLAFREKRLEIREALNARQDDPTESASSTDHN